MENNNQSASKVDFEEMKQHHLQEEIEWEKLYGPVADKIADDVERNRENRRERRWRRAYDFGGLCQITGGAAVRWRNGNFYFGEEKKLVESNDPEYLSFLDNMRKESPANQKKIVAAINRPRYYAAENARRRELAKERRKIRRRRTTNQCPTKFDILKAWIKRNDSHEDALRFGGLIEDLECFIDNKLNRTLDGGIVGRRPGIKGWLKKNIPALRHKYTTVMRFKSMSKKLRQISDLFDPTPSSVIIKAPVDPLTETDKIDVPVYVVKARAIWEEVIQGIPKNVTALFRRINALTNPNNIEDANMLTEWKAKYDSMITEESKHTWWFIRLWKKILG